MLSYRTTPLGGGGDTNTAINLLLNSKLKEDSDANSNATKFLFNVSRSTKTGIGGKSSSTIEQTGLEPISVTPPRPMSTGKQGWQKPMLGNMFRLVNMLSPVSTTMNTVDEGGRSPTNAQQKESNTTPSRSGTAHNADSQGDSIVQTKLSNPEPQEANIKIRMVLLYLIQVN